MNALNVVDLFCGAGGSSTGMMDAFKALGRDIHLTAINHWDRAIETHSKNYPEHTHYCANVEDVEPKKLFKANEKIKVVWASPSCTHHSVARGGKPKEEQNRASAGDIIKWLRQCKPEILLVENVKDFMAWGALYPKDHPQAGQPIKERKGELFEAWLRRIKAAGYIYEHRLLRACDYGDPTSRLRFFLQAVPKNSGRKITWPDPTHGPDTSRPYRTAREIINWNDLGTSAFGRKKPLVEKTWNRIITGLEKYSGIKLRPDGKFEFTDKADLTPFILPQQRGGRQVKGIDEPVSPIMCKSAEFLATPVIAIARGQSIAQDVDKPLNTVTAGSHHQLIQPFLTKLRGTGKANDVNEPLHTISAQGTHHAIATPYLMHTAHSDKTEAGMRSRVKSVDDPLPTITGNRGDMALATPCLVDIDNRSASANASVKGTDTPLTTIVTKQKHAIMTPFLYRYYSTAAEGSDINAPVTTIRTKDGQALIVPILVYNGDEYGLDILFRMLQPDELAAATGFPADYQFTGTKTDIVKQIGNANPCGLTKALTLAAVTQDSNVAQWDDAA